MDREISPRSDGRPEADGGVWRRGRDWHSVFGLSGAFSGTNRKAFFYGAVAFCLLVAAVNAINIITIDHEHPKWGIALPILLEGSSFITIALFCWIPYIALRIAPLGSWRRWQTGLTHICAALLFSACHVAGFVAIRKFAYWLAGQGYDFGGVAPFAYEFRKDVFGYAISIAAFAVAARLAGQSAAQATVLQDRFYVIRDGAKATRVLLDDVLAISSAGNYVEFVMRGGHRLLMRSPLSALENELALRGFVRTHRSWLVNANAMTALKPEGSGDYTVALGGMEAPLSRRFPQALVKLRGG